MSETHLQLRGAYDIGLGNLPYDEKARRRFSHHLKAVEHGAGPIHTLALARIYVMGALEVAPDLKEAARWYEHAIEQGSAEAVHELQRLSSCVDLLATESLDGTRIQRCSLRAAVEGISDIKHNQAAASHFMESDGVG
jgi:TPR repeat protein